MGVVHETPESAIVIKRKSAVTEVKEEPVNQGMEGLRKAHDKFI